jgi:hypothetical protein
VDNDKCSALTKEASDKMLREDSTSLSLSISFMIPLLATLAVATTSIAQETPTETISPIAAEITKSIDQALTLATGATPQQTAVRQRTRDAAVEMMKDVGAMAVAYEKRVQQSKSIGDTEFFFDSLRSSVTAVRATARDAVPNPSVAVHLDRLDELIDQLATIYTKAH